MAAVISKTLIQNCQPLILLHVFGIKRLPNSIIIVSYAKVRVSRYLGSCIFYIISGTTSPNAGKASLFGFGRNKWNSFSILQNMSQSGGRLAVAGVLPQTRHQAARRIPHRAAHTIKHGAAEYKLTT